LADLAGARLSLAAQTAKAYFALTEARMQLDLARATVESYRKSAAGVRERFERGIRSSLDLRLSLAALAGSEALYEQRMEQHDRALRQLEILLGRYPGGSARFDEILPDPPAPPPAGLPADLVGRRPDIVAAERRLAASDARVRQAKAALFPSIRLTGSGGRSSQELGDLLDGDFTVWSLAAGVLQPLFRGGELRARVDLAGAGSRQALASYANALLQAYGEVESALAAEGFLAAREEALTRASEQSAAARALAEERYRSGLEDLVTLLEAQRRALAAESERISTVRLLLENRVDLCVALGGGFEENSE
jgi:multidrug efflux system outer membrane protein